MGGKLDRIKDKLSLRDRPLIRGCISECLGTMILLMLTLGIVAQQFFGNEDKNVQHKVGSFDVGSLAWGFAVAFAMLASGFGGHASVNPALALAYGIVGRMPIHRVPFYILCQTLGAWLGALVVFGVYYEKIHEFADRHDAGKLLVETTGLVFVLKPSSSQSTSFINIMTSMAILSFVILSTVDTNGWDMPAYLHPIYVSIIVFVLICGFDLNSGCPLNPTRDFGPRLAILMCGWGTAAFSAHDYYFWIPLVATFVGAIIGAVLYEALIGIHCPVKPELTEASEVQMEDQPYPYIAE